MNDQGIPPGLARGGDVTGCCRVLGAAPGSFVGSVAGSVHEELVAVVDQSVEQGLGDDGAYRGMDFLLDALEEIAAEVFASVAHLLNLDLDIVFVATTSTYWETETADDLAELADDDDEISSPTEAGTRQGTTGPTCRRW